MELAQVLPTLNAVLNGTSGLLLASGFWAIRRRRIDLHRRLMLGAFGSSSLFLASYLLRFALTGVHHYPATGASKTVYLAVLGSHTLLAAAVVPLVLRSISRCSRSASTRTSG